MVNIYILTQAMALPLLPALECPFNKYYVIEHHKVARWVCGSRQNTLLLINTVPAFLFGLFLVYILGIIFSNFLLFLLLFLFLHFLLFIITIKWSSASKYTVSKSERS